MPMCPKLIVPLQIELALGVRRYLFVATPLHEMSDAITAAST
jgi:hypothetical protein